MHWSVEDWSKIILRDESNFEVINRKNKVIVIRLHGEKNTLSFANQVFKAEGIQPGKSNLFPIKGLDVAAITPLELISSTIKTLWKTY